MYAFELAVRFPELVCFASGVLTQVFVLRHGEWNLYGPTFVAIAFCSWALITIISNGINISPSVLFSSTLVATKMTWSAIFGIVFSMFVYRLLFHRLRGFPGPLGAKVSSWWPSTLHGKHWHFFDGISACHAQYGDYVRIAPDALSITNPTVVNAIHSLDSICIKGSFYSIAEPQRNLLMIRGKTEHAKKRREWDRAFNVKSLNDYEPIVWKYTQQLMDQLKANAGKPMNIAKWLQFYAFDVMTDLAFGRSFDSTLKGAPSRIMEEVEAPVFIFGLFKYVPWVAHFFKHVPFMVAHKAKFDTYLDTLVQERKAMVDAKPDIFSHFLDPYMKETVKTDQMHKNLIGDAMLIVIAGSGPLAPAIASVLLHLAERADLAEKLYEELEGAGFDVGGRNWNQLGTLKLLEALINESLRLHPPIRSGPERMTPPEGLQVGDVYIPGNIRLQTPLYPLQRDPRSFVKPNDFIPERWLDQSDLIKDHSMFLAFMGSGTFSCVGKALALLQMRQVIASIVWEYKIEPSSDRMVEEFLDDTKDYFACFANTLNVVFTLRSRK